VGQIVGFTSEGKPLFRIAGGSESAGIDIQGQVAAALSGGQGTSQPSGDNSLEPPGTDGDLKLSGFAKDFLSKVAEAERPILQKYLPEWDKNVQVKFREYQDTQSQYEPWQDFLNQGYDPDYVAQTIQLAQLLENNPQAVYEALVQQYNFGNNQEEEQNLEEEEEIPAWAKQQQEALSAMAEIILAQREELEMDQADEELESYLDSLKEEFGEFDEDYVTALIGEGIDGEEAVNRYNRAVQSQLEKINGANNGAPLILSSGGGLPSEPIDPGSLDSKQVKDIVTKLLQQPG